MRHGLHIRVSREKVNDGLVTCRKVTIREKLLRFLLGSPIGLTVLVPGRSVDEIGISELDTAKPKPTD